MVPRDAAIGMEMIKARLIVIWAALCGWTK